MGIRIKIVMTDGRYELGVEGDGPLDKLLEKMREELGEGWDLKEVESVWVIGEMHPLKDKVMVTGERGDE